MTPFEIFESNLAYYTSERKEIMPELDAAILQCSDAPCANYCIIDVGYIYNNYVGKSKAAGLKYMEENQFVFAIMSMFSDSKLLYSSDKCYIMGAVSLFKALHADKTPAHDA